MLIVDTDGDGATDHFVPVLGYDDRGELGQFYGLYTTWSEDETVVWQPFVGVGRPCVVYGATILLPVTPPVPEMPIHLAILLGLSVMALRPRVDRPSGS
jgi:hypothetical protein